MRKILAEFEKYLNGLASESADYARAKKALVELNEALEVLDPVDPVQDAARLAAGLSVSSQKPVSGDPILDAARRGAGLPE